MELREKKNMKTAKIQWLKGWKLELLLSSNNQIITDLDY